MAETVAYAGGVAGFRDNALVTAYLEGNDEAFRVLVSRYQGKLVNYINTLVHDYDLAVDLAQETFIRVFRYADRYKGDYQFSTWIYRIATNLAIDELRRRERKGLFSLRHMIGLFQKDGKPLAIPDVRPTPERTLDGKERLEKLQGAVDSLPQKYRVPFLLKEVEDLSYEEICRVLQISMGTVKSRIHRAKMLLREKLAGIL
ncbi:MAG: sigma-70 family RNA polymerase sigma factor [Acidobacteria bacterium]|nr:MAG: sigma-70 family RNA polymerase sigma factor [Acidobacteriota bacterium]